MSDLIKSKCFCKEYLVVLNKIDLNFDPTQNVNAIIINGHLID